MNFVDPFSEIYNWTGPYKISSQPFRRPSRTSRTTSNWIYNNKIFLVFSTQFHTPGWLKRSHMPYTTTLHIKAWHRTRNSAHHWLRKIAHNAFSEDASDEPDRNTWPSNWITFPKSLNFYSKAPTSVWVAWFFDRSKVHLWAVILLPHFADWWQLFRNTAFTKPFAECALITNSYTTAGMWTTASSYISQVGVKHIHGIFSHNRIFTKHQFY